MPPPLMLWRRLHWSFFVNTQGLLLALRRFEAAIDGGNTAAARTELTAAADLMRASGASMRLAGSFSRDDYERQVRPSMMPPGVGVEDFSGLMSWDHASLIQLWKRLTPVFASLPASLREAHADFVAAYKTLASSHRAVCSRFGGNESGSIRYQGKPALDILQRFESSRRGLIDPGTARAALGESSKEER